jgi:hypothetical protein
LAKYTPLAQHTLHDGGGELLEENVSQKKLVGATPVLIDLEPILVVVENDVPRDELKFT